MSKIFSEGDLKFCEETLIPAITETAQAHIGKEYSVEKKGHGNFVTDTDKKIEADMKRVLGQILPDAGFLAEEGTVSEGGQSGYRWIVDPIDGTTNYIYGFPYAVSVALEYIPDEEAVAGVVYVPSDGTVYYAVRGMGSYMIKDGRKQRLHVGTFEKNEGVAIFGLPYDRSKAKSLFGTAAKYYEDCSDLKRIGPSSLDICRVASGRAKIYFEPDLQKWDVAAGLLILTEAGGHYRKDGDLLIFSAE